MMADAEAVAEEGTAQSWKMKAKEPGNETFTHEHSVKLHLVLMDKTRHKKPYEWKCMSVIWGLIVSSANVPECLFDWLSKNFLFL